MKIDKKVQRNMNHVGEEMKKQLLVAVLVMIMASSGGLNRAVAASLDLVYAPIDEGDLSVQSGEAWTTQTLKANTHTYTALAPDAALPARVYGARSGGLDLFYLNGTSWATETLNSNTYVALSPDKSQDNRIYGARSGGLDLIYHSSGVWTTHY